jgi:hypothetical protein
VELGYVKRLFTRVDVVAGKHEEVWLLGEHGVPERLWLALVGAGGHADAQARGTRRWRRGATTAEKDGGSHPAEQVPATQCGPLVPARHPIRPQHPRVRRGGL